MPQTERTEKIKTLFKDIKRQLKSRQPDLVQIGEHLKRLRRYKLDDTLLVEYNRLETEYREKLDARGKALEKQVETLLRKYRDTLAKDELPEEDWSDEARAALKELADLRLAQDQLPRWQEELRRLERERNDLAQVLDITREVKALWSSAERSEQERGNPAQIVETVKQALSVVEGYLKHKHITTPEARRKLETLKSQAEARVRDVGERHETVPTRVAGEEVVNQFKIFLKMDPKKLVTFPESAEPGARPVVQTVEQAIPIAKQKIIQFWDEKVNAYTDAARALLDKDHDPYGAQRELEKCYELPGLNDPTIGLQLSGEAQHRINTLKKPIEDAVQARQTAEALLQQALIAFDLSEAYKLFHQAIETDRFTPDLANTRARLQQRILKQVTTYIEYADEWIKEGGWEQAKGVLEQAQTLLALDPDVENDSLAKRIASLQKILADVEKVKAEVMLARERNLQEAKNILDRFIERYTEAQVEKWDDIRQLRNEIEAQVDARRAIERFKARISPAATLEQLEEAWEDYEQERLAIAEPYRREFETLKFELEARLGYRRAQQKKENDLAGALAALQPALNYTADPELNEQARALRSELEAQRESDQHAQRAIEEIRTIIATNPQKAYKDAQFWKKAKTFYTNEFVRLEQQAREVWEQNTKAMLDSVLTQQPLDMSAVRRIRDGLAELQEMHSDLEVEYRAKTEVLCAITEAEYKERSTPPYGNTPWSEVVAAWESAYQKAILYAGNEAPRYWARRLQARKRQVREETRNALPSRQIDLYSQLNAEFDETDAEVWLWLGQAHLQMAEKLVTEDTKLR